MAAWSFDAKRLIAAAPGSETALLIDVVKGELIRELEVAAEIANLALSESGGMAAIARADGIVSLIDFSPTERERSLPAGASAVRAVVLSGRRVVAAGDDGVVRIWDVENGRLLAERSIGTGLTALAVAPDSARLAVGDHDGGVRVLALPSLGPVAQRRQHSTAVTGIVWTGSFLVSGDAGGTVAIGHAAGG